MVLGWILGIGIGASSSAFFSITDGNARDYQRDLERVIGSLESDHDKKQEERARSVVGQIESDRKKVGMRPAEMYRIFETQGIAELRKELDRRLRKLSTNV